MNNIDKQYQELLADILDNGVEKGDRTGTGTLSVFGRQIRHKMSEGYPLLTTKKMAFKTMVTELLWFLKGDTNIKYLVDNGCNIWNGDAYKNFKRNTDNDMTMDEFIHNIKINNEFAQMHGELGPIYGKQWREWTVSEDTSYEGQFVWVDQIQYLIKQLKENPDSRRLLVSAWNVGELHEMVLPPCHYGFQVYTREMTLKERRKEWAKRLGKDESYAKNLFEEELDTEKFPRRKLSLMWNQRSVDTFLGLPFNIASYGLLLIILAKEANMIPEELVGNLGDVHLYSNHLEQAKKQIRRESMKLPNVLMKDHLDGFDTIIDILRPKDFILDGYESHPTIKAPLSN